MVTVVSSSREELPHSESPAKNWAQRLLPPATMQKANYYAGSPLNRLSYLRTSSSFLQSALTSPKAKFVLLADLNLLCATDATGASRLDLLGWEDVRGALKGSVEYLQWVDDASEKLETDDERDAAATESKQQNFDQVCSPAYQGTSHVL